MFHRSIPNSITDVKIIKILKIIILLMRLSFAGIIVFGIIRTITYRQYEWNQLAGQGQITLLLVKHIILTMAFIFGLVYYFKASSLVRKVSDEKS
jgi:phage shock protein PspC (stress-responsive transcriptional regulator)